MAEGLMIEHPGDDVGEGWEDGIAPICEFCAVEVYREEANLCDSCGCWFHPTCLTNHQGECAEESGRG